MRYPLRFQTMVPMAIVMFAALSTVSVLNAYFSARRTALRIENELSGIVDTLADAVFPLTNGVLEKMHGLSGADFIAMTKGGQLVASSARVEDTADLAYESRTDLSGVLSRGKPISLGGRGYYHGAVELRSFSSSGKPLVLHILYPEESYDQAWRDSVYPPMLVGALAIVLVMAIASAIAARVTYPLSRLQGQVDRIADGDFQPIALPGRNDEVADLSRSINRMAARLAEYESSIRRSERMRTLGQLGAGIAHQIRNSVTGCRMAIGLHARSCPTSKSCEGLQVANRELELMEALVKRLLRMGRTESSPHVPTDLASVVDSAVALVGPTARHAGVQLRWSVPHQGVYVHGDAESLEQMLLNLLLNAIEATSQRAARRQSDHGEPAAPAEVTVRLNDESIERVILEVLDSGVGPPADAREQIFDPFVTRKPDGIGLGLAVARETARAHGGDIQWRRQNQLTCFAVELPRCSRPDDTVPSRPTNSNFVQTGG